LTAERSSRYLNGSWRSALFAEPRTFRLLAVHVRHLLSDGESMEAIAIFSADSSDATVHARRTHSPRYLLWMNFLRTIVSGRGPFDMECTMPDRQFLLDKSFAPWHEPQSTSSDKPSSSLNSAGQLVSGFKAGTSFFVGPRLCTMVSHVQNWDLYGSALSRLHVVVRQHYSRV
jgi:hypothetical protein